MTGASRRTGAVGDAGALDKAGTLSHKSDLSTGPLPITGLIVALYGLRCGLDQTTESEQDDPPRRMNGDCGNATMASFGQRKALNLSAFGILTDETGRAKECFRLGPGIELSFRGIAGHLPPKDIE
jgi:hypothetical protein